MPRINKAIELLAEDQPIYYTGAAEHSYKGGVKAAKTWADYINYEMEHHPLDITRLQEFMEGLVDGGPTRSGHRMPAVVVTLPIDGTSEAAIRANTWIIKQVLATGVHGLLLCHAESPDAVRAFVESARYPFNTNGVGEGLGVGRRGGGGQASASAIWGVPMREYLNVADPWPLNPRGELMLGLKIENKRALENCEQSLSVPGLSFAEWGPGDMGMSLGFPDQHDPPYPPEMVAARARVFSACKANKLAFLNGVYAHDVVDQIKEGVRVCPPREGESTADIGRKFTGRTMPW